MSREQVFIGRDNKILRKLQAAGVDLDAGQQAAVTRVKVRVGDLCIDTDEATDPISYADGVVEMQLGLITGITAGLQVAQISVYDAETPLGAAWGEFQILVQEWPCVAS